MGWRGWTQCVRGHKNHVESAKNTFFVFEKYVEVVKQGQKVALDLVESIIRPPGPVKEKLRRISVKMNQYRSKITKIKVYFLGCPENRRIPAGSQHSLLAQQVLTHLNPITALQTRINQKNALTNCGFCPFGAGQPASKMRA